MEHDRDAQKVDEPSGQPPDEGLAYDPAMTDTDEANIPPDSEADPEGSEKTERASG
ncbi:MAG: hypothetical protein M3Y29_06325 [Chloroflexota bacterium]|nr:hypothetical protein [Chloroflexota bacterium]